MGVAGWVQAVRTVCIIDSMKREAGLGGITFGVRPQASRTHYIHGRIAGGPEGGSSLQKTEYIMVPPAIMPPRRNLKPRNTENTDSLHIKQYIIRNKETFRAHR